MTETHYVVYAVDDDYWMPLYVSIHSLLVNNQDLSLEIFVLYSDRDGPFFDNVEELVRVHGNVTVTGIEVDDGIFADAPTPQIGRAHV